MGLIFHLLVQCAGVLVVTSVPQLHTDIRSLPTHFTIWTTATSWPTLTSTVVQTLTKTDVVTIWPDRIKATSTIPNTPQFTLNLPQASTTPESFGGDSNQCNYTITVKTGDGSDAGTDSSVHNVLKFLTLKSSKWRLRIGGNDEYLEIPLKLKDGKTEVKLCIHISAEDPTGEYDPFYVPIHPLAESNLIDLIDGLIDDDTCSIPQHGTSLQTKLEFQFTYILTAAMVKNLPPAEAFSFFYAMELIYHLAVIFVEQLLHTYEWVKTGNILDIYYGYFPPPKVIEYWKDDAWFGAQRVQGVVPNIIELCLEIPEKLRVTEDTVKGLLDGMTLQQALQNKKIFITDLHVLDGIEYKSFPYINHASPIALFYLNEKDELKPIAIQLWQEKGPNNPVYTPNDQNNTWTVAKMYYNNAEAQLHEIMYHFCYTHLIMDGIATSMNRQLAPANPVYKLLKPHFRFTMAINKHAEKAIFSTKGKLDLFSIGTAGTKKLNAKAVPLFTFDRAIGSVESDATARKVWDRQILPYYPFRDDASSIYDITKKYVTTILTNCYDTPEAVQNDRFLQNYRRELVKPRGPDGGVGIKGLPGNDTTGFSNVSEVIDMVTVFIIQCSVGHAAVNFPQYDTYGWMPNYPADIKGAPPRKKVPYTEEDIMGLLPDKENYIGVMGITKLLSWDGTNELGDYVKTYFTDPVSVAALEEYKKDLKEFSNVVKNRNRDRKFPYKYLDPEYVPNAISI